MNWIQEARTILESAGYRTKTSGESDNIFNFEDNTIMGVFVYYEAADDLIDEWETHQDVFLNQNSKYFKIDPIKTWNLYSVHVTDREASDPEMTAINKIEENFRGTRKIAVSDLKSKKDLVDALLPILPIQNKIQIFNSQDREQLLNRLSPRGGPLEGLLDKTPAEVIAKRLSSK